MQAIKAIYDGVNFKPKQPVPVKGYYKVIITFIEPLSIDVNTKENENLQFWRDFDALIELVDDARIEEEQARLEWLDKIEAALELSSDETELLKNFPKQEMMKISYDDWLD